jgi:excisionase family DNA binding protein
LIDARDGPAITVSGPDLLLLDRQLRAALQRAYGAPGQLVPRWLLDYAIAVNKLAGSAGSGSGRRSGAGAEPEKFRDGGRAGAWPQPATVSVTEAARAAEVSEGYVRRLVRRRDIEASRDRPGGAYRVQADSLAAWMDRRRKEATDPEAA